jgi:serine/threonine protein phosphatase PrpC
MMASEARLNPSLSRMGATLAGLVVRERGATAFNCGDSRVYRISRGALERLTRDHSVVQALFESGRIDEDGMRNHPRKNIVTSAVSAGQPVPPELYARGVSRVPQDSYFLCTDGVWEALPAERLSAILSGPFPDAAQDLLEALLEAECRDNVSFILAR